MAASVGSGSEPSPNETDEDFQRRVELEIEEHLFNINSGYLRKLYDEIQNEKVSSNESRSGSE